VKAHDSGGGTSFPFLIRAPVSLHYTGCVRVATFVRAYNQQPPPAPRRCSTSRTCWFMQILKHGKPRGRPLCTTRLIIITTLSIYCFRFISPGISIRGFPLQQPTGNNKQEITVHTEDFLVSRGVQGSSCIIAWQ
jgi:hypothetical protein